MSLAPAAIGGQADPRLSTEADAIGSYANRVLHTLHDPNVTFEEYLYYASISRSEEARLYGKGRKAHNETGVSLPPPPAAAAAAAPVDQGEQEKTPSAPVELKRTTGENEESTAPPVQSSEGPKEKVVMDVGTNEGSSNDNSLSGYDNVTDQEWVQASRAVRTATWGAVFYLITTDILGPSSVP